MLILIILVSAGSCNKPSSDRTTISSLDTGDVNSGIQGIDTKTNATSSDEELADWDSTETLDWDSIKIQGVIPLITTSNSLIEQIGKPDSIITPNYENMCTDDYFGDYPFQFAYFGLSSFKQFKGKVIISNIDYPTSRIFLSHPKIQLSKETSLEEIRLKFPIAYSNMFDTELPVYKKLKAIRLKKSHEKFSGHWVLFFLNGKLVWMNYTYVC